MLNKFHFFVALLLGAFLVAPARAQTPTGTPRATIQPTIMVIPFTREKEDIRRVLDGDVNRRIAITKVKEAFDNRGFSTVDFVAKLKETETRQVFTSENLTDIKTQIIEYAGADIYVETEAVWQASSSGNSAQVILTAYDASTGASLSNKVGFSGKFYTDDVAKLTAKATESVIEDFLNVLNTKFGEIVENGRLVAIEFNISPESALRMSTEIDGDGLPLSDALEVWMGDNAYKGNYHVQGASDLKVIFDQVRIPFKDKNGNSNTANKYALEVFKACRNMAYGGTKISVKKEVKGNTIFITLS